MIRKTLILSAAALLGGCIIDASDGLHDDQSLVSISRADLIARITGRLTVAGPGDRVTAFARCPVGYVAISGGHGFTTTGGSNVEEWDFYLWRSIPWRVPGSSGPFDSWRAEGVLDGEFESWQLWVTATCYRWQPSERDVDFPNIEIPQIDNSL